MSQDMTRIDMTVTALLRRRLIEQMPVTDRSLCWREADQDPVRLFITEAGRVAILAGLNNDLANFWDWYADGQMPLKPATDAFRIGTSAVLYSLTH